MLAELERLYPATPTDPIGGLRRLVEHTSRFGALDPWQIHLCDLLDREVVHGRGARLLIHAPPQMGKSCIVSHRLPAAILATDPLARVKIACYNVSRATRFAAVVRDVMQIAYPDLAPPSPNRAEEWSTPHRLGLHDPQPSVKALGLLTGFVGEGADTLIIDDPYASPQDARSDAVNESVWTFWDAAARVRITERTNVVVMFHRYRIDDLAGRLIEREGLQEHGGVWRLVRYAAKWETDDEYPCAPRNIYTDDGYLSQRRSLDWYRQQEESAEWPGQFQGRPVQVGGAFFRPGRMEIVQAGPVAIRSVRGWDLAASGGDGDYTVGARMSIDAAGRVTVEDVVRGRWAPDERDSTMRQVNALDPPNVIWTIPEDPGQAGKDQAMRLVRMLAPRPVVVRRPTGDKMTRAAPFASQVNAGNVQMLQSCASRAILDEMAAFPRGAHDDVVDAMADAYSVLVPAAQGIRVLE